MQVDNFEKESDLKLKQVFSIKQKELVNLHVDGQTSFPTFHNYKDPYLLEKTDLKDLIPTKIELYYGVSYLSTVSLESYSGVELIEFD